MSSTKVPVGGSQQNNSGGDAIGNPTYIPTSVLRESLVGDRANEPGTPTDIVFRVGVARFAGIVVAGLALAILMKLLH